jgi:hypothetical protein
MQRPWYERLERKLDFIAIPGLASFIAGLNAVVGILTLIRYDFPTQLVLEPELVRRGEAWRLLTYLIVPPEISTLWLFFWLILFYMYLQMLERYWGDLRLTLYCAIGALAADAVAMTFNVPLTNTAFNTSLFLAFARLNPDFEIMLFFFFPVKMRWLFLVTAFLLGVSFAFGGTIERLSTAAGVLNYLIFFGQGHWQDLKWRLRRRKW